MCAFIIFFQETKVPLKSKHLRQANFQSDLKDMYTYSLPKADKENIQHKQPCHEYQLKGAGKDWE